MKNVVFVAPYFGANMQHALRCFAGLEDVRLGVVTHEPREHIPADIAARIAGHYRVTDALNPLQLVEATRAFAAEWGRVDRLEGYLEQMQVPLAEARDALDIDGLRAEAAKNFRDKNRMKRVLREAGVAVARQALLHSADDARRFIGEVGYPIVLKPLAGAGAINTLRASSDDELYAALNILMPRPENPVQAEEFVRGAEHSFETVALDGEPVWWSSTYYLPGPLQVLENPWMQYCVVLPREVSLPHIEAFRPINAAAISALGLRTGLTHMEWFRQADGRAIVSEVGARPPGANITTIMGIAHGVDMWAKWARLMVHRTWDMPNRHYAVGCAFLRGQGRGEVVRAVHGVEAAQEKVKGLVWEAKLPTPGQPRSAGYEGEGWVIVRHPTTQGVVDALGAVVQTIRVELG